MEMELRSAQQAAYWRGRYQSRPCPRLSVRSTARYISRNIAGGSTKLITDRSPNAICEPPSQLSLVKRNGPQINWPTNCNGLTSGYGSPKLL
jgi:hypothetical protein